MAQQFIQAQKFTLSGSGAAATDTSITLASFTMPNGDNIVTADLGTTAYGTLEPGTSREEIISFTGVTQNADGTATITGITRGLDYASPYTAVAGNRKAHAGGTNFVLSNNPQVYNDLISFNEDVTITGKFTFPGGGNADAPVSGSSYSAPTDDLEYASKKYADDLAIAGSPDMTTSVKGIAEEATEAEIDADTGAGGTGARLAVNPSTLATSKYGTQLPSADEKAALAGTSGTPSGTNKYVTDDDTPTSATADSIPRADSDNKIDNNWIKAYFGGDGSDGALSVPSGTTNIDASSENIVIKNYSSINIASGATLGLTNPASDGTILYLKSIGDVTIEGTIDVSGAGAVGGVAVAYAGVSIAENGLVGTNGYFAKQIDRQDHYGKAGDVDSGGDDASGGGGASAVTIGTSSGAIGSATASGVNPIYDYPITINDFTVQKRLTLVCGSGGGSGAIRATGTASSGAGGRGGGVIVIECGGALNFTGTIDAGGADGADGTGSAASWASGGGGGGAGGEIIILYSELTANTGSAVITGGTGGTKAENGGGYNASDGGDGGDGYSIITTQIDI